MNTLIYIYEIKIQRSINILQRIYETVRDASSTLFLEHKPRWRWEALTRTNVCSLDSKGDF